MKKFLLSFLCLMTLFALNAADSYKLITSVDELGESAECIIVSTSRGLAMGTNQTDNNRSGVAVTITDNTIEPGETVAIVTVAKSGTNYTFYVSNGESTGYLYAASSSKNYLRTNSTPTPAEVAIDVNGNATVKFTGSYTHNLLKCNTSADIFSCYLSGQKEIQLFKKVDSNPGDTRQPANLSFPEKSYTAMLGETFTAPELTKDTTADVTYVSDNESVATVDETTGAIEIVGLGTTTITATTPENYDYRAGEASYTITVKDPNALDETLTASDFNITTKYQNYTFNTDFADYTTFAYASNGIQWNNSSTRDCGLIANGKEGFHIVSVKISTWGSSTKNLNIYASNTDYSEVGDLKNETAVGTISAGSTAEYVFNGNFKNFGIRPSTTNACQVNNIVVVWAPDKVSSVATPVISLPSGEYYTEQSIEINCATDGATIYYTLDNTKPTVDSTPYTGAFTIDATTTVRAIAVLNGEESNEASATYTFVTAITSIADMESVIGYPELNQSSAEFVVNCDLTVNYVNASGRYIYVYVNDGVNCGLINAQNITGVAVGDVIAKGWKATIKNYNGLYEIVPANAADVKANGETGTVTEPIVLDANNAAEILVAANVCKPVKVAKMYFFNAPEGKTIIGSFDEGQTETVTCYNTFGLTEFANLGDKNGEIEGYISIYTQATTGRAIEDGIQLLVTKIGTTTGVEGVTIDDANAPAVYFNLQGVRVENPTKGGLYIKRQGSTVVKVIM